MVGSQCRTCKLNPKLAKLIKEIQFITPLRRYFPEVRIQFSPPQLCFLCQCIEDARHVKGAIFEVGCFTRLTTVFLNQYRDAQNIEKPYYAIDTFSGFVSADIEFEVANRGKIRKLYTVFRDNQKKWFDRTMQQNQITRVRSIEADINKFDLTTIGSISFSLLDVDLYRPTHKALQELYEVLSPGGIIVVDDCDSSDIRWDGSDQPYKEFMNEIDQAPQIIHGKLGVI